MRVTTLEHPAAEGGTVGEKCPGILPKYRLPLSIKWSFTCRKDTTWDRRLYFPSEGRRAEDFFALKIRRLRPGVNSRTWVPKASTLALDHRSRKKVGIFSEKETEWATELFWTFRGKKKFLSLTVLVWTVVYSRNFLLQIVISLIIWYQNPPKIKLC
jgi:hypothetical protein